MKYFVSILFVLLSVNAFADAPYCSSGDGRYCAYSGYVEALYVNEHNLILLYFDTALPAGEASKVGLSVSGTKAVALSLTANPDFAKLFYSTALAAQAANKRVDIQMRSTFLGYLQADRIWINKD